MDYERRFGGVSRLYTKAGAEAIRKANFVVIGVGGVGSWAAEALVRTAAEHITLIDLDNVAESNTNRQIQALDDEFGKAKIVALKERFSLINPLAEISLVEDFVDEENVGELIPKGAYVLDCIDQVRAKAAIVAECRKKHSFVVTSGAAGGRINPLRIQTGDLARISGDPLLANVRYRLRKSYGFPAVGKKLPLLFHVPAVFSDEPIKKPENLSCDIKLASGLQCAGYGSGVTVTAPMGMACAALAIQAVLEDEKNEL